ncbi:Hypothetical protein, putative [Bodo saltans]|uniref:Uncharacterized protein n=1 Tax=Bodo saltans TaxID=75058 RepID=A0A0S4IQS2_BODSA|nr:Hypothetical protein, putative [Bodo saltans]|eukprot:CUF33288.1 Hypothetical protein, putative [Bodo saltans]
MVAIPATQSLMISSSLRGAATTAPQHGCHTGNTTVERLCAAQESNGALLRVQLDLYNKRRNAYAATGRIPSCALSSFHSDIRTCLDEVSKHCTHVSRCPLPDYVSPGNNRSVDNSSAIDTDQGVEVAENALRTAAPTHVQQQQSTRSSIIKPRVVSIMTMAAERWQRTAPSSNDPNGGGHTRMHYTCDTRNDFMEWNVSSRHLTMYCATFNETQHERDQLAKLHRLKVRWMRTARGNLTIVEEWAADNMNRSAAERQALRDDCALWQRTMEPLWTIPDLFSHESLAEEVLEGRRRMSPSSYSASSANTTLSNRSLHATRRKDDEIRVAVDWAVSATYENIATCRQLVDVNALSSMDKLYHIFPHSCDEAEGRRDSCCSRLGGQCHV